MSCKYKKLQVRNGSIMIILTGSYSCLRVDFIFKRDFSFYLTQYYVPCCMLVIVSWVSFWLDAKSVPARVSLGVTTLLTMSTQTSSINQSLPPVSYTKVSIRYFFPFDPHHFRYFATVYQSQDMN